MGATWPTAYSAAGHGTRAGYQMHRSTGSVVCQPCRDAQNAYMRDYMRAHYSPRARRARYLASKEAAA